VSTEAYPPADHPQRFRLLFLVVAALLLWLVLRNTNHLLNLGNDDNFFQTSRSRFYLSEDIEGARLIRSSFIGERDEIITGPSRGDLVLAIDGRPLTSFADVYAALERRPVPRTVTLDIQRPDRLEYFLTFDVPGSALHDQLLWQIPPTVYVFAILPGGAAEAAGLQRGDLIHAIDGQSFTNAVEADKLVRGTLRGRTVDYGIYRDGRFMTLELTMARLSISLSLVLFLMAGYAWFAAAIVLAMWRPGLKAARLLAFGWLFSGSGFLLYETRGLELTNLFPDTLRMLGWAMLYLGPAILIHAGFYFPRENPELLRAKRWRYAAYPAAVLAWALTAGLGEDVVGIALLVLFAPLVVFRILVRDRIGREQTKLEQYLFTAAIIALLSAQGWSAFHDSLGPDIERLLRCLAAVVVLLAYIFTMTRYRLLGFAVRRGPLYVFATTAWLLFVWGGFVWLMTALAASDLNVLNVSLTRSTIELNVEVPPETRDRNENLTLMLLALLAGAVFYRITAWGRVRLRRSFHRADYDFLTASTELTELFASRIELEDLARGLADNLVRRMLIKRVWILVFDSSGSAIAAVVRDHDGREREVLSPKLAPLLADHLERYRTTLRVDYLGDRLKGELRGAGFRYLQPVRTKNRLLGCLAVGEKLAETAYRPDDFRFLAAAAKQASVAVENALLYDQLARRERLAHELELARHIQISSLPQCEPTVSCLDISGASIPALEVGGDYYAYFTPEPDMLTVVVADVSGKGTSAALYMSKMQGIFASLQLARPSPRELFVRANPILYREIEKTAFITAICARLDMKRRILTLARAGHAPLICYRANAREGCLHQPRGLGLGLEDKGLFAELLEEVEIPLEANDVFVFTTDGLTEAHNDANELFGEQRLLELLRGLAHHDAATIRNKIMDVLVDFSFGTEQNDDQTLVVVKVTEDDCGRKGNRVE